MLLGSHQSRLFRILTFAAQKNIMSIWIENTLPITVEWNKLLFELILMEYLYDLHTLLIVLKGMMPYNGMGKITSMKYYY